MDALFNANHGQSSQHTRRESVPQTPLALCVEGHPQNGSDSLCQSNLVFLTSFRLQLLNSGISAPFHPLGQGILELRKRATDQSLSNSSHHLFISNQIASLPSSGGNPAWSRRAARGRHRLSRQGPFPQTGHH